MGAGTVRPGWVEYFLSIAEVVATRADCTRRRVGAVITKDNRIMATGYNGGPPKGPSCLQGECPRGQKTMEEIPPGSSYDTGPGSCIAIHAEQNALLYCSREDRLGGVLYVTEEPCGGCQKMLNASGLSRAYWPGGQVIYGRS